VKSLNVGIIGIGFIGPHHIDAIRRIPGAKIGAICDPDEEVLRTARERYCIEQGYLDWRDLLADTQLDVIHNCTPNHIHDPVNRLAIQSGKHIYAEKPLSLSAQSAKELWQSAVAANVAHAVNYQYRMNAAVQEMRARIRSGESGRTLFVRGQYLQESHARKTDYTRRLIPETSPARAIADIGSHWVDTACCALGMPVTAVFADMHTHHPIRIDPQTGNPIAISSDDTTAVLLRFVDGTPGMMLASKVASGHKNDLVVTVDGELCEYSWEQQLPDRLYIGRREAENGELFMNRVGVLPSSLPYISTPGGHVMGWSDALRNSISAFYCAIWENSYQHRAQPYATFEDGWRANVFIEGCIRSSQEHRWIELDYQ